MPNPALHGNGIPCPGCELRRAADLARSVFGSGRLTCNSCKGTGRLARRAEDIIAEAVAEARAHYWSKKTYA